MTMVEAGRARRPHFKSRTGCGNCKRRRIKCDEARPSCKKCMSFEIRCDYEVDASTPSSDSTTSPSSTTAQAYPAKRAGRPRKQWTPEASLLPQPLSPHGNESDEGIANIDDVRLMFHYTNTVARTIAGKGQIRQMWERGVPEVAFKHPFLLELLLSLSALHLARFGDERQRFALLAETHESAGMRGLTQAMTCIDRENARAIYVATTLCCYVHLGKGPRIGDCLVFAEDGTPSWFTMFRGIRSVSEFMPEEGFSAVLRQMEPRDDEMEDDASAPVSTATHEQRRLEWESHFEKMKDFIEATEVIHQSLCLRILSGLQEIYKKTFGSTDEAALAADETGHLPFAWLYILDDEFVKRVQNHDAIPLVIMTYYAVLLRRLEAHWWLEGWASNIVQSVARLVRNDYHELLLWPLQQVTFLSVIK